MNELHFNFESCYGIGLAVYHKIIHQHKGSINVESSLGAGAKFIVCLPVRQEHRGERLTTDQY